LDEASQNSNPEFVPSFKIPVIVIIKKGKSNRRRFICQSMKGGLLGKSKILIIDIKLLSQTNFIALDALQPISICILFNK